MDSDSPFEKYFDNDYYPTPSEILEIRKLIDGRQAIADYLDVRIAELDRMRKELEDERRTHSKFIARHRNLTTAIRSLPTDILFTIFLAVHTMSTELSSPHPSVALSHVSHQWRRLCLAMPLLWARIGISTPTPAPDEEYRSDEWMQHVHSSCERAATFIRRAGGKPLEFAMVFQDPFDDTMSKKVALSETSDNVIPNVIGEAFTGLDDIFHPAVSRLALRINTSMPASLIYIRFLDMLKASNKLTVDIDYIKPGQVEDFFWEALENRIPLRGGASTSLALRMRQGDLHRVDVDWRTLTGLSLGPSVSASSRAYSALGVMPIIVQLVGLVKLSLDLWHTAAQWVQPVPPQPGAHLLSLRTLHIRANLIPSWFVRCFDIPSLTNLSLTSYDSTQEQDKDRSALVTFTQQYGHQLIDLTCDYHDFDIQVLSYALGLLPKVEVLQLTSSHRPVTQRGTFAILDSLSTVPAPPLAEQAGRSLVPMLRRLVCDLHGTTSDVRDRVIGFIQARRSGENEGGPVRWLEEVDVRFNRGSVYGMVEELRSRGVKTTLIQIRTLGR